MTQRVMVYIDGFNLYYGLKSKGWKRYYWLDLHRLAEKLLRPGQQLVMVRYFTAQLRTDNLQKWKRQTTYLEALAIIPNLHIHYGHYISKDSTCRQCGATWKSYEEKMTDVNIAVEFLGDAQDNAFDTAIIISGDSDLSGMVNSFLRRYPNKQVMVAFPPNRVSKQLRQEATASFPIYRNQLRDSQLPDPVIKPDGYPLTKPPTWS